MVRTYPQGNLLPPSLNLSANLEKLTYAMNVPGEAAKRLRSSKASGSNPKKPGYATYSWAISSARSAPEVCLKIA
jgi:hypothetical protein